MSGGVPAGWVLVPVADLRVLADLRQHIHQHEPDRVKWEGEWHYGPLATAFISTIEAVADAADAMLAATPTPPIEGRDADVERVEKVARALCEERIRRVRRWDTPPERLEVMMLAAVEYSWKDFIPKAHAALQALGERG